MATPLKIRIRLKLSTKPGTLAKVLTAIGQAGGKLGTIDLIDSTPAHVVRDVTVILRRRADLDNLLNSLDGIPESSVVHIADWVFLAHLGGKIETRLKRGIHNSEDLSLVYTPGVARVSRVIAEKPEMAYKLTLKANTVAVVSDGSAILGLGNLGASAAIPVMEGKAALFKRFANIDAVPLCLDTQDTDELVRIVTACAPCFGGINLEDIAAPRCFEVEDRLKELLDIPVFHDDQHGTAVVVLAGLINALKVVGKSLEGIRLVISGAGAAGMAITKMLMNAGVKDIVVCDRKGAISAKNMPQNREKQWLALNTNREGITGSLRDVLPGADVFIGVSGPGLLHREDVAGMAQKPVVFALANPEPEVEPEEIMEIAGVIATGRSDYPNQINNVLAFPGIFRGALDCHASTINDEMCLAAAGALASLVPEDHISPENIIAPVFKPDVAATVARAVVEAAVRTGVSRKYLPDTGDGMDILL